MELILSLIDCKFLHCCLRCREATHTAIDCPQRKLNPTPPHPLEQPPPGTNFRPHADPTNHHKHVDSHAHTTSQDSCSSLMEYQSTPLPNESSDIMLLESEFANNSQVTSHAYPLYNTRDYYPYTAATSHPQKFYHLEHSS